jgi:hypothetical protein
MFNPYWDESTTGIIRDTGSHSIVTDGNLFSGKAANIPNYSNNSTWIEAHNWQTGPSYAFTFEMWIKGIIPTCTSGNHPFAELNFTDGKGIQIYNKDDDAVWLRSASFGPNVTGMLGGLVQSTSDPWFMFSLSIGWSGENNRFIMCMQIYASSP